MRTLHLAFTPVQVAMLTALGCATSAEGGTPPTLDSVSDEPPGPHCEGGGLRIDVGLDLDRDGSLGASESSGAHYLCHGANATAGPSSLVAVGDEPAGSNCAAGGKVILTGIDADGSAALELGEASSRQYVCNGVEGTPGSPAAVSSIRMIEEPPGVQCPLGGVQIAVGVDDGEGAGDTGDGVLHDDEVDVVTYACDRASGIRARDANGFELGRLVREKAELNAAGILVFLSDAGYAYFLNSDGGFLPWFGTLFFSGVDCTGEMYAAGVAANEGYSGSNFAIRHLDQIFKTAGGGEGYQYASNDTFGNCTNQPTSGIGYPVTLSTFAELGVPEEVAVPITYY